MARLWQGGIELNGISVEGGTSAGVVAGDLQTGTTRSGTYALEIHNLVSASRKGVLFDFTGNNTANYYVRTYLNVATFPTATNRIIILSSSSNISAGSAFHMAFIELNSDGTLQLNDEDGAIGSPSSALSSNTWYRIEFHVQRATGAGDGTVEAKLEGTVFATSSTRSISSASFNNLVMGANLNTEAQTQGDWFFDDFAVNDNTGTFQNSYPGSGRILHLRPNGAGDSTGWTPDSGSNYARVNEVKPDDGTSYVSSNTLNTSDFYTVDDSGLSPGDTVNVVAVGIRYANNIADATTRLRAQIMKTSGGTVAFGTQFAPNSTTYRTNEATTDCKYTLVTYQDPDLSAWSSTTLDSMQIGAQLSTGGTNSIRLSTIWASVDYTPDTATTTSTSSTSSSTSSTSTSSTSSSTSSTSSSTSSTSSSVSSTSSSTSTVPTAAAHYPLSY